MATQAQNRPDRPGGAGLVAGHAVLPDASWPSAKIRAFERGVAHAQQMLEETGGTFSLGEVSAHLGISRQSVVRRVKSGSLFSVPGPARQRRYPAIQFTADGGVIPGLKALIAALEVGSPYSLLWFLITPIDLLGYKRAIDLLLVGDLNLVLRAALNLNEQGA